MSKEYIHAPRLVFVNDEKQVLGFIRTTGHSDEVFSRRSQTDAIRAYCAGRGLSEPSVLPTADWDALLRNVAVGAVLIVPDVKSLLRKPSDIHKLIQWANQYRVSVHCLELGGDITEKLHLIRLVSEAYEPVEAESVELRKQLRATEQSIGEVINDVLQATLPQMTRKVFESVRHDASRMVSEIHAGIASKDAVVQLRIKQAQEIAAKAGAKTPPWHAAKTAELMEAHRSDQERQELQAQHDQDAKGYTRTAEDWAELEQANMAASEKAREERRQDRSRHLPKVDSEGWADIKAS